jgi:hypothetical protein
MIYNSPHLLLSGGQSGGGQSSAPQLTPQQMISLYQSSLPGVLGTTSSAIAPVSNALATGTAAANPVYTAAGLSQLNNYAPGYQAAGNQLATTQAQNTNTLLNGAGGQAAASAVGLNNALNPTQAAANTASQNLLSSINLNGLSPGEQNSVQRSLNQSNYATGNLGLDNATNAVSNALNFGGAFNSKLGILGSAIGTANSTAANQNAQVNPLSAATSASNTSNNFGLGTFNPTQANSTATAPLQTATSFGNQLAGISGAPISSGSQSSYNVGCFLTTACCEYKGLPDDCEELETLRHFRDTYVPHELVEAYYQKAPFIVKKVKNDVQTLEYIYKIVRLCVDKIHKGELDGAVIEYKNMVVHLEGI